MRLSVRSVARRGVILVSAALCLMGSGLPHADAAPATFNFRGRGWGHGVGMSQWGAQGLADKNWHVDRILARFYRGTSMQHVSLPGSIRVGLLQEQARIDVSGDGRFDLYDGKGKLRASGNRSETWRVQQAGGQMSVSDPSGTVSFTTPAPVTIRYETRGTLLSLPQTGHRFKHGRIDLDLNASTGKLRAILIIPFEQYLYGLGEMPAAWHIEALKAQAIAGRTYADEKVLRLGQNRPVCNCGVYASTADQAYVGVSQEVARWVQSVDATKSIVLTYQGKPIQAYYSSSDGGFTENNENVFGGSALPYLRGVCDPGDYMNGSNPNANWIITMNGDQLGQKLQAGGYNIGSAKAISFPGPRGVSGRVRGVIDSTHGGVVVNGTTGTARLSGDRLRTLAGLRSTLLLYHVAGDIRNRYDGLDCAPGLPGGEEFTWRDLSGSVRGSAQNFGQSRLFRNASTNKVFWTRGPILSRYDSLRSQKIDLGLPVSDEFAISGGRRSNFERGYITWNASNGQTAFHQN